jgi:hypothetical protein
VTSEVSLELQIGPITAMPVTRDVMEALTDVSVRASATGPSGFDLKFAVSTTSPLITELLPAGYFDPPTRVIISAVLRGVRTVLIDGVITHHEMAPSSDSGKSTLSIKGDDLTRMLDLIDLTGFPFPGMAAETRVALMLAKYAPIYGIVPMVVPSVLLVVSNPLAQIHGQRGTDLTYIKQLAATVGYVFYLQPGPEPGMSTAYWGPQMRAPIPFLPTPPPIAIGWDQRTNVESLQFSFDGFSATQYIVYIQAEGGVTIAIPVPNVNPISPPLAIKPPIPLKISKIEGLAKYDPIQAAAIALGKAAETANRLVSGQGSLDVLRYGAILNARTLIDVHGAGLTYDGTYFVESVSHTIKAGSYKQSFTLSRNALVGDTGPVTVSVNGQQLAGFAPPPPTAPPVPAWGGPPTPIPPPAVLPSALPTPATPMSPGTQQPAMAGGIASLPASPRRSP